MSLVALLNEGLVKTGLESLDKDELFEEMVDTMVQAGAIDDRKPIVQAIRTREESMTTGIGKGVAIPHAKNTPINGVAVCVGTSPEGIEYDAIDGEPVHLVFMVVSGEDCPELNVQTLAAIARAMSMPGAFRRLTEAESSEAFLAALEDLETEE